MLYNVKKEIIAYENTLYIATYLICDVFNWMWRNITRK